jgi:hypothetical protein
MSFYDDASLVFLPSGQAGKDGKAYSMKPTNGDGDFTFSRGSNLTATRIDSNGLIAKGRENLLLQSNSFDTTWSKTNTNPLGGQSGYDGSTDAWKIEADTASTTLITQGVSISGVTTASIYAKEGTTNWFRFSINDSGVNTRAWFDLSGSGATGTTAGNIIDTNIESVGNGYFRCSITFNATAATLLLFLADGNGTLNPDAGDYIYIQDAQLEQGLVATEYIESGASKGLAGILEDSPRFDYSGGASCPSLLLEPSRTNEIGYSEYFEGWTPQGSPTITSNYGTSPEGLQNSSRLVFTSASDYVETSVTNTSGVFTLYAKGTGNLILTDSGSNASSTTALTSSYQRIELYFSTNTTTLQIKTDSSGLDAEVYAAQFENATYPTSYIPNHSGGSVTREEENIVINSLDQTYSTDITLFFEVERLVGNSEINKLVFLISDASGGGNNIIQFYSTDNGRIRVLIKDDTGSFDNLFSSNNSFIQGTSVKVAIKITQSGCTLFVDGSSVATSSSVGRILGIDKINYIKDSIIKQFLLFPSALSDSECITLTS